MDISAVDPELRRYIARLPTIDPSKGLMRVLGRRGVAVMPTYRADGVTTSWVRDGGIRVRVYRPESAGTGAGLLWIHGGGLVIGSPKQDDRLCANTAADLGITVVSIVYRLAPEAAVPRRDR